MSTHVVSVIDWSELFNPSEPRYEPVDTVSIWDMLGNKISDVILNGLESAMLSFITGLPIMIGVSVGVYALISMFSKTLARYGVIGVFIYGGLVAVL